MSKLLADVPGASAKSLELFAFLEALKKPEEGVSFRVTLPNVELVKDGTIENEYDIVSVVLKADKHVEVWVWGVTTEAKIAPKRTADMAKIQKLNDLLGARWEDDVRVVTSYVHLENGAVCCQIDGTQVRRQIPTID